RGALAESPGMPKRGDTGGVGQRLLEQTHTFGDELGAEERQAGDVAAWPRERGHEPVLDRIAHHCRDDRRCGGRLLHRAGRRRILGDDEVKLERGELICQARETLDPPVCPSVFDEDALPLQIAALAQPLPKSIDGRSRLGRFDRTGHEITDARHFRALLRLRRQRPRHGRAADERYELAPTHSITSSTLASSCGPRTTDYNRSQTKVSGVHRNKKGRRMTASGQYRRTKAGNSFVRCPLSPKNGQIGRRLAKSA